MEKPEDKPLVRNAADPEQVQVAATKQKRARELELDDTRSILNTVEGRRFFWRYLNTTGVFMSSMTGDSYTFFKEGERNVGLRMLADINEAYPESYALMMKEAAARQRENG